MGPLTTWGHILVPFIYNRSRTECMKNSQVNWRQLSKRLLNSDTTVEKIKSLSNCNNSRLMFDFHDFMRENGPSERHQNNNLKIILLFAKLINSKSLTDIDKKDDILTFLQSKIKDKEFDPDQKRITTYNDYLHRLKHFFRWLYNGRENAATGLESTYVTQATKTSGI